MLDELIDRYGDPPASVSGLVDVSLVRVTAAGAGIVEIAQRGGSLLLYSDTLSVERIRPLLEALPGRVTMNAKGRPYLAVKVLPGEKPVDTLRAALAPLAALAAPTKEEAPGE